MELSVMKSYTHENNLAINRYDDLTGPHREMAIDCPSNFIGTKKEPPRFPRPLSVIQNSSQVPTTVNLNNNLKNKTPGNKTDKLSKEDEIIQQNKLKKYKEELQKRRELEEKIQKEQEFLRTSLRGSKKLQELKEPPSRLIATSSGFVNPNYIPEEEAVRKRKKAEAVGNHLDIEDIVASVHHVQKYLTNPDDKKELNVISDFVLNEKFQKLLKVHNKVVDANLNGLAIPRNKFQSAQQARNSVLENVSLSNHHAARELSYLLNKPAVKNVVAAHDKIAKIGPDDTAKLAAFEAEEREYLNSRASLYGDSCIKIVRINKSTEPLGATVRNDQEKVVIGRIVKGSMAEQSGLLHEGDEILEINGHDVRGKTVNDVSELMMGLNGQLTFLIHPADNFTPFKNPDNQTVHLRALFNYDPDDDNYVPCKELGFSFMKGDVLHVIDTSDPNWWQAYREGEEDQSLAGLIPSPSFQLKREELKREILGDMKENMKKQKCQCMSKSKKKNSTSHQNSIESDTEEHLAYEEVALYYPQPNKKRPIVLIGPKDVGRQELRQKLMESDFERFAAAVPHTSRPPKPGEINHVNFHFVSKQEFEADIKENIFIEYGEFQKHYFGTSMDAIKYVVNSGKICILNLYPQALKVLKASDLKPYFIFVAPPNIESLRQFKIRQGVKVTDETLNNIIKESRDIDYSYGHYFDLVITITDLERAYEELLYSINQLEVEPQWVPISWLS